MAVRKRILRFNLAIFCAIGLLFHSYQASAINLSDSSQISLLTCSPGNELYAAFGHSGIRITDFNQGFDIVFNYGTFDFNQPDFYLNFCKGHMIYMLGLDRFVDFREEYIYEQRNIYEQVLFLGNSDKKKLFDFLMNNAQLENRNYRYDFLFDNCATRIRDVFTKNIDKLYIDYSSIKEKKSFRDLINDYSETDPWSQFGMNLLIGLPVDKTATPAQMCFLPDYLSRAFSHTSVDGSIVSGPVKLILEMPEKKQNAKTIDQLLTPRIFFATLLILTFLAAFIELKSGRHFYWIDFMVFAITGAMGCLFLALAFTEHTTTQWNLNLLWAWPLHFFVALLLPFNKKKRWLQHYFKYSAFSSGLVFIGWKLLPQKFLISIVMIAGLVAIRSYTTYRHTLKLRAFN